MVLVFRGRILTAVLKRYSKCTGFRMSSGGTRFARSPSYGSTSTYGSSYLSGYATSSHTMPSSNYGSTYNSSYSPSYNTHTEYSTSPRSRTLSRDNDYSSKYGTGSLPRPRPSSRTRYRSPSRGRDDYSSSTRSTPTDITTGRPLPKGPGTRDRYGKPIDHRDHISTLKTTLSRASSVSREPRGPVRADHMYGVSSPDTSSPGRLSRGKRTNSVADLANRFEDLHVGVKNSRKFGSNADLSGTFTSSRKLDDVSGYGTTGRKRTTSYSSGENTSPLPDISVTNKTSRSPSLDGRDSFDSKHRGSDDILSSSSKNAHENFNGKSSRSNDYSKTNGHISDYNNNKGVVGLRNIGNTCFMNSVVQCLSNTRPLLEYCLNEDYKGDINSKTSNMKGQLIKVYASVMRSIWKGSGETAFTPTDFKSQIAKFAKRFVGYNQQDAQEFLVYLLEGLHEDINRVQEKKKRIIDDSDEVETISASEKAKLCWNNYLDHDSSKMVELFVGQLRSTLTCTVCGYASNTFDPFWDLSLPICKNGGGVDLQDCFDLFTQEESLEKDERPTCAKCKKRQRCKKRFSIQKFPKVLVIHLKRFNQGSYYRSKLSTCVDFPINGLDLSTYSAERKGSIIYDLYAVSNHSGSTGGGHYTAYAKNPYSGQWHYFNDQSVSTISESRVRSSEGYVLFYQLQGSPSRL